MSCYKYLYCGGKNKSIILHSFARKTKVSYYITFFQTLLKTFSYSLCYSDRRIILSYCKKRKVNYYVCRQEEQYIPFNEQQKCHVKNIYTVEEKQEYHITFFCEKNQSIILHHVLPNSTENVFPTAFVMLKLQQQCRNCQTKYRTIIQVKEENRRFIWLSYTNVGMLHCTQTKCFYKSLTNYLIDIQFSLTTVQDTDLATRYSDLFYIFVTDYI